MCRQICWPKTTFLPQLPGNGSDGQTNIGVADFGLKVDSCGVINFHRR